MAQKKKVGYLPEDFKKSYGKYYDETIIELAPQVQYALENTPFPAGALPPFSEAKYLEEDGYTDLETGYTNEPDGSIHAAIVTAMPGVTPEMWDWWFGWHGSQDSRYKLWHPKSHVSAVWEDGEEDISYIGRNSIIEEYIVDEFAEGLIQFKQPTEFGISYEAIKDPSKAIYICARLGHSKFPIDYGYLVHQVRAVEGGSEMRSRFWMGGQYIHIRKDGLLADLASSFVQKMKILSPDFGRKIVIHCSEEMNHLAAFLPKLYAEMNQTIEKLNIEGRVIERTDEDFESVVMGSLFNKIDPGKRPIKVVEAKSVQDIIETIKYAKSHGKKLNVCSGGHSFSANHIRDNSILLMMKNFN
ncbi:MAG: FAD-binding protein [Leadbetterella sp.]|nr:FAD-binding protein [Leadbetterella sp.]